MNNIRRFQLNLTRDIRVSILFSFARVISRSTALIEKKIFNVIFHLLDFHHPPFRFNFNVITRKTLTHIISASFDFIEYKDIEDCTVI